MSGSSVCLHPGSVAGIILGSVVAGALVMALVLHLRSRRAHMNSHTPNISTYKPDSSSAVQQALVSGTHIAQNSRHESPDSSPIAVATNYAALPMSSPSVGTAASNIYAALDDPDIVILPSPRAHMNAVRDGISPSSVNSASLNEPDPLRSRALNMDELASLPTLIPQRATPSPSSSSKEGESRVQHMLDELTRLKSQMGQLAFREDASPLSRSTTSRSPADRDPSQFPRRVKENRALSPSQPHHLRAASPRKAAPASPRYAAAVASSYQHSRMAPPDGRIKAGVAACTLPSPPSSPRLELTPPDVVAYNVFQQQQHEHEHQLQQSWNHQNTNAALVSPPAPAARTLQLPPPQETYPDSHLSPAAAATPSRIARISSAPSAASPSEVYVEISRLVAEAYQAVAPHLTQQLPVQARGDAPPTPPRHQAPAAAASPAKTKSPASPKPVASAAGKRPTWRGAAL